jgi:hypothetical protein
VTPTLSLIFVLTYAAIIFEHPLGLNKSVAKMSDSYGKGMCDDEKCLAYLR